MSSAGFNPSDFKVFEIPGFKPRMDAIKHRIRPKLEAVGHELLPDVARVGGGRGLRPRGPAPRRTVNPPDDTWVAFALDERGYKKHCHFKVAVSRGGVRFLFEAGPEHAEKKRWVAAWKRHTRQLVPVLRRAKDLGWFKDEHDEAPAAVLTDLPADAVALLGDELRAHPRRPVRAGPPRPRRGGGEVEAARVRARRARDVPPAGAAVSVAVSETSLPSPLRGEGQGEGEGGRPLTS